LPKKTTLPYDGKLSTGGDLLGQAHFVGAYFVCENDLFYFPMQIIVLLDNLSYSILPVQKRYYFGIGIERKVLISKYSSSNFVMQI
jgi:hypothetical protein